MQPKHEISDAGPAVYAVSFAPITASDIRSPNVSVNFRNFVISTDNSYTSGLWTIAGPWTVVGEEDGETLHLEGTIALNRFGGAGVFWPGGSANVYSRIDISYPGNPSTGATPRN